MIDDKIKEKLNLLGEELSLTLRGFYGKVTFNFYNGKYVNANIEQSIKNENSKKGEQKCMK